MNLILFMSVLALALSFGFVACYLWALSNGQYDDLDTPAHRILKEDLVLLNKKEGITNE